MISCTGGPAQCCWPLAPGPCEEIGAVVRAVWLSADHLLRPAPAAIGLRSVLMSGYLTALSPFNHSPAPLHRPAGPPDASATGLDSRLRSSRRSDGFLLFALGAVFLSAAKSGSRLFQVLSAVTSICFQRAAPCRASFVYSAP
ncbi:hypothetical protein SKAU_G00184660 [Synaphobranchus kaupii]|uniref:Uncharacterized protein n=1 Tax=Synaphobranchus kaupii TaxID=118154 RepID=A0A9Q1IUK2_SYNKA|nr:hypothetical protein SKAU_G00184660 [Synaphobranchus kaupii]